MSFQQFKVIFYHLQHLISVCSHIPLFTISKLKTVEMTIISQEKNMKCVRSGHQ